MCGPTPTIPILNPDFWFSYLTNAETQTTPDEPVDRIDFVGICAGVDEDNAREAELSLATDASISGSEDVAFAAATTTLTTPQESEA